MDITLELMTFYQFYNQRVFTLSLHVEVTGGVFDLNNCMFAAPAMLHI